MYDAAELPLHVHLLSSDDYLDLCSKYEKESEKSFKGSFNIRISSELHRKAFRKSQREGISLNQLVQKALEKETANSV